MSQPSDPTGPVDLGETRELAAGDPWSGGPAGTGPTSAPTEPIWATAPGPPPSTAASAEAPPTPSAPPAPPVPPVPAGPDSGGSGTPPESAATSAPPPARRGPGWGALLLVTALCTLLAGLGGGLLGGWLAATGNLTVPQGTASTRKGAPPSPGAGAHTRPTGSIAQIAATAMPSVVTIKVDAADTRGTGSGWVFDDRGHIVTNNHVVDSAADGGRITVVLSNGRQAAATVVGRDAPYDLAVLKVDRTDLTPLPIGDSSTVVVGDQVIAVGAPLGLASTVTAGIVSALDRPVAAGDSRDTSFINAIQTDAAINPGNSGGPLLNMSGEVIGVNSAIATAPGSVFGTTAGNIGVGFAIPSNQVTKTVEQLITTGKAVHPVIGVYLDQQYQGEGVRILSELPTGQPPVTPGGPADKAGLTAGDVIVALNGRPMTDPDALVVGIRALDVGDTVTLTVRRDGQDRDVTMVLEASSN